MVAEEGRGSTAHGRAPVGPVPVNLLLGIPAVVPLWAARWLITEYLPMDCRSPRDVVRPGLADCDHTTLDHAGPMMLLLALTGCLLLGLVLLVDVVLPRGRGRRLRPWLLGMLLIPLPYLGLSLLA